MKFSFKRRWQKILLAFAIIFAIIFVLQQNAGRSKNIEYGVTFSQPYARNLGLDWKRVYDDMLEDLGVKLIRIPIYWNELEKEQGKYDFSDMDYMLAKAKAENSKIILAIGKRLPRWPECHVPEWAGKLPQDSQNNAQLSYMEAVVRRYALDQTVVVWQVENEPFLSSFGPCPNLDVDFFNREIAFVKQLDPSRPILITDSGELSSWLRAGSRGDQFGSTYYRYVYSDVLKRYWTNFYFPAWFYRLKAGVIRLFNHQKPVMIAELEAEPWTTAGIINTPIEEQFKTMSLEKFNIITSLSAKTGFSPQILWGVEWWYWMRGQGHMEFWESVKSLINSGN